jgi:hypothetical protein
MTSLSVQVTDGIGTATVPLPISIASALAVAPTTLPIAHKGQAYIGNTLTASGGTPNYVWSWTSPTYGLVLTPSGPQNNTLSITGIPVGVFVTPVTITITLKDTRCTTGACVRTVVLTINPT